MGKNSSSFGVGMRLALLAAAVAVATRPSRAAETKASKPPSKPSAAAGAGQGMPAFDAIMVDALKSRSIPGGALAIARNGKLLMARGYGLANVRSGDPVTADTLFCTASITKTITAVAVLRLVDQGKLSLDDPVYSLLGKPRPVGPAAIDPRIEKITVRELLLNAGGWNTRYHLDFLHQTQRIARVTSTKQPLSSDMVLRYGLSQPLDFSPGTESHYSSFGFFLAKLIVERCARQPYETYVRQQVLRPMGISQMRMEQLGPAYAPREAHRYGASGRELSGGREPISAPAGNWLGSVIDLARFLTAVSGTGNKPFLTSAARRQMLAAGPPPLAERSSGSHVGLGWDSVIEESGGSQCRKSGSEPGVRVYIEHRADGIDWVVLFNSDGNVDGRPPVLTDIAKKIRQAIDATHAWPDRDLFKGP
jgi:CubicO group peptidase (beta-lactamase class C family)